VNKKYPAVFAVVLNYNGFDDTKDCVNSLLASNRSLNIIIVDNNSSDDSYNKLTHLFSNLKFIESDKNLGYAGGMNLGIKYSLSQGADFILLVNQDVVVTPDFLEPMLVKFYNDSKIGIVSSKVIYKNPDYKIYCAGGKISRLLCTGVAEYQGMQASDYANEDREITLAEGCFMLIKAEVIYKIGFFNEKYFMYLEDVEFSERVRKHYKIVYTNKSIIYHEGGAGKSWARFTPLYNYYYTRNRLWFFKGKSFVEKLYVFVLSIMIFVVKSISIIFKGKKEKLFLLRALWSGLIDGIILMIGIKTRFISRKENKYSPI